MLSKDYLSLEDILSDLTPGNIDLKQELENLFELAHYQSNSFQFLFKIGATFPI